MSCLRKLLPLVVLLASFEQNAAGSPLSSQASAPRKPSPSSPPSPEDKPLSADAEVWRRMAEVWEGEVRKLTGERDHLSAEALKCQAKRQEAEELFHEMIAKALTAVFDETKIELRGSDVLVTVELLNAADEPSRGTAFLVLLLDDKVAATAEEPVSMAPNAGAAVTHRFAGAAGKGKLSVNVSFNP